uniref:Uncharacterized protein n=1 Tax=Glossina austeni TaxID=7395 RepID=A0A1A9UNK9_GLOAU
MELHRHRSSYVVGIVNNGSTHGLTVILPNTIISDVQVGAELFIIETVQMHGKNCVISLNNAGNTAPNFNMLSDLMSAVVWKLDHNDINGSLSMIYNTFLHVTSVLNKSESGSPPPTPHLCS